MERAGDLCIRVQAGLALGRYEFTLDDAATILGSDRGAAAEVMSAGAAPRDRDLGRVRLRFYTSKHIHEDKVQRITSPG